MGRGGADFDFLILKMENISHIFHRNMRFIFFISSMKKYIFIFHFLD